MSDEHERARAQWSYRGNGRPTWAIEPEPGQESVWDYPRPPKLEPESRWVRVLHCGTVIAETQRATRVLETASPPTYYIHPEDVREDLLVRASGASFCEWKGSATYWSLRLDGTEVSRAAWSYEQPSPEFSSIRGHYGFYPAKLECFVGGNRVEPQPGNFYGGWVTPEIVGPFKGEPGTGGW